MRVALLPLVALAAAMGCGGDAAPVADTVAAIGTPVTSADPAPVAAACPRSGHWTRCQLERRLSMSGLAPREDSARTVPLGEVPALGIEPVVYLVGNSGLAVYMYADSTARKRAAASLDTLRFIPQSRSLSSLSETTAIQNDNLLVLLFSRNEQQRERVADALMAGAPQP